MKEKFKKNSSVRKLGITTLIIVAIVAFGAFLCYKRFAMDTFTEKSFMVYVNPQTTYPELLDTLKARISEESFTKFKKIADMDGFDTKIRPGAYRIDPSMSSLDAYKVFLYGLQTPVKFTFNNIRTMEQFASRVQKQLMIDSAQVMAAANDTAFINELGYNRCTLPAMFMPDSYQVYWTIDSKELFRKMKSESDRFWTSERISKSEALGFSPLEISIVASITEEETNNRKERGAVGRLYLNRLQKGMMLQADPTVKFAIGDFSLRRILNVHLKYDSPYNTYKYAGVPPGPIRMPSKSTIDAILSSEPHEYIFMCAKEDFSGLHNFAKTLREHNQNAQKYHRALNAAKIR